MHLRASEARCVHLPETSCNHDLLTTESLFFFEPFLEKFNELFVLAAQHLSEKNIIPTIERAVGAVDALTIEKAVHLIGMKDVPTATLATRGFWTHFPLPFSSLGS